jgi:hypothetical protein
MSKHNWLKFAGLLNSCIYRLDHKSCPFKQYRKMDQYQRMEFLLSVGTEKANKMMNSCQCRQKECSPIVFQKQNSGKRLAIIV